MEDWKACLVLVLLAGCAGLCGAQAGGAPAQGGEPTAGATAIDYGDAGWTTDQIIKAAGYPCEIHKIQTEDGYVLTVFRIPYGKGQEPGDSRPPFWLQHGLVGSSDQYVQLGPEKALGFILADKGYDVWIGNTRGNRYCQENVRFSTEDPQFWDFSWDEMGYYDLPADITYVLNTTKKEKMFYTGHSMGIAMFMVFLTTHPEFQEKIEMGFALAPAVFVGHSRSLVFNYFCMYYSPYILKKYGPCPLLPSNFTQFQNSFWPKCSPEYSTSIICERLYELTSGPTTDLNPYTLPTVMSTNPSQTSAKTLAHYGQSIETGEFRAFNYGKQGNMEKYGSPEPPIYDLKKIATPMVIMFADDDYIVPPYDEYELCLSLGHVVDYYRVPLHTFDHMDFLYGWTTKDLVYKKILEILSEGPSVLEKTAVCYNDTDLS